MDAKIIGQDFFDTMRIVSATIGHEVRNPLSLAQASLNCILLEDTEKKYAELCGLIGSALQRAAEATVMYDQIWKPESATDEINAYRFVHKVMREYEIVNPNIRFCIRCPNETLSFTSDRKKLEIVLSNVLKNAVESVDGAGLGAIEIGCIAQEGRIILTCADNGHGLSGESLDRIKSGVRFTTKKHGHGLGLGICKRIIDELGGALILENRIEGGCRATITIRANAEQVA